MKKLLLSALFAFSGLVFAHGADEECAEDETYDECVAAQSHSHDADDAAEADAEADSEEAPAEEDAAEEDAEEEEM